MAESMQRICVRRNGRTITQNGCPQKKLTGDWKPTVRN
jgi:hypothetical protein